MFACIDLDTVIVGDVTPIFARTEPFVGYRDSKNPRCYSGCFYMMDAGAKEEAYKTFKRLYMMIPPQHRREHFLQHYNRYSELVGSDQSWQSEVIGNPDKPGAPPRWTWEDGVWDFWNVEELPMLPENSRIIFCNGLRRDPSMKSIQDKYPWVIEFWKTNFEFSINNLVPIQSDTMPTLYSLPRWCPQFIVFEEIPPFR